jgi:hypothetical protein
MSRGKHDRGRTLDQICDAAWDRAPESIKRGRGFQRRLRRALRDGADQPWIERWGPAHDDEAARAPDHSDVSEMGRDVDEDLR